MTLIGGEARARHIYIREGAVEETVIAWRSTFGESVDIFTRSDAAKLFGDEVSEDSLDRMGDIVAVPRGTLLLLDPAIADREGKMVGHHGGFTRDEVLIPLLSCRT